MFCLCKVLAIQIIPQTYQTLRITIALLERKKKHLNVFYLGEEQTTKPVTTCLLLTNSVWVL